MAYDLEEQEQLAAIKAWWNRYGGLTMWLLIACLLGYSAWVGWKTYLEKQSANAAVLHQELQTAVASKDNAKTQQIAGDLQEKFSKTAYAEMAGLIAAKSAMEANDQARAKLQLKWVIDQGSSDEYKAIAKLRLAGVLLDEKKYDEAVAVLDTTFPEPFQAAVSDRRGDVLMAQKKIAEARQAYDIALQKMGQNNPGRQLIQIKLDALGGASARQGA